MRLLLPLALGGLSLMGCSSDNATGSPSGGSGGASTDAGSSDAGASAEASDGAEVESGESGSGDSGVAPKSGFIGLLSRATADPTMFSNSVGASFFDGPGNSYLIGCQHEIVGTCQIQLCDFTDGGNQSPPTGPAQSAGTLTIGGTTPTFSLTYDAPTMQYVAAPAVPIDKLLYTGGDTIAFAAVGADVPAFAGSIIAPSPITVTSPAVANGTLSIDTSKDLVFNWTGSSAGTVAFNVRTVTATVLITFVSCQFVASAETGTIPTAMLQKLKKTDATTVATITTDHSNAKEVAAGDYMVDLAVGSVAFSADGKTPFTPAQIIIF